MDCEAQPDEKREAESLGIKLLDIVEVEVSVLDVCSKMILNAVCAC